jgi:hypothetical protein
MDDSRKYIEYRGPDLRDSANNLRLREFFLVFVAVFRFFFALFGHKGTCRQELTRLSVKSIGHE